MFTRIFTRNWPRYLGAKILQQIMFPRAARARRTHPLLDVRHQVLRKPTRRTAFAAPIVYSTYPAQAANSPRIMDARADVNEGENEIEQAPEARTPQPRTSWTVAHRVNRPAATRANGGLRGSCATRWRR